LAAVLGVLAIVKGGNKKIHGAITIIIVGTLAQLLGGYFDYNFHTKYGIDGLVTPSHLTVETGLLLSAIGGMIMISKIRKTWLKALIPISIITVLLSASWIGFNLSLLLGAVVECVPVYQLFSSGCAVM
jgi:predicted ATP-dependent protease